MRFLLLCLLFSSASAQVYNVTSDWSFDQTQLDSFLSQLNRTTEDQWMFHWGDLISGLRYARQGFIDQQELDVLNAGSGSGGGGFYVSLDPTDTSYYGVFPTAVLIEKGTLLFTSYDTTETMRLLEILRCPFADLLIQDVVSLGAIVPFLDAYFSPNHRVGSKWRAIHNAKLTTRVKPGYLLEGLIRDEIIKVVEDDKISVVCSIDSVQRNISRHVALFSYIGELNLNEDLWNDVDTEKFEGYYTLHRYVTDQSKEETSTGGITTRFKRTIGSRHESKWGGIGFSKAEQWATNHTRYFIPELYTMAGHNDTSEMWRKSEKVVGDNVTGVIVSDQELETLRNNPYITLSILYRDEEKKRTAVQYWHPDVFHYKKARSASLVSYETAELISSVSEEKLVAHEQLRQQLNARLMQDLMQIGLERMFNTSWNDNRGALFHLIDSIAPTSYVKPLELWASLGCHSEENCRTLLRGASTMLPHRSFEQSIVQHSHTLCADIVQFVSNVSAIEQLQGLIDGALPSLSDIDYRQTSWRNVAATFSRSEFPGQMTWEFSEEKCKLMREENVTSDLVFLVHYTPQLDHLLQTCQTGNVQLFQLVRQAGPPFHTIQRQMWINCLVKQHKDLLRHLIEHPQLPFKQTDSAALCEILSHAVTHNSIDMLEFLLDLSTSNELLGGHSLALKAASLQGNIDKTPHKTHNVSSFSPFLELLLEDEKMVSLMFQLFREDVNLWASGGKPRTNYVLYLPLRLKHVAHLRKLKDIIRKIDRRESLNSIVDSIEARIEALPAPNSIADLSKMIVSTSEPSCRPTHWYGGSNKGLNLYDQPLNVLNFQVLNVSNK
ncbi:hypothetical protein PROFUN_09328 [Planoprotostelium fungivorum]|uniref:Uncharacterized protein n=1 Tax=Planoprotostelium fungivorum TaxID=1890364 RepID=A0A2P6NHC4_9EUKA|nr:hypothetical protein PROFUN_09328 [Planoprotostelium fungivorum]